MHSAFEPSDDDSGYKVYPDANDQSDAFQAEEVLDHYDREVLWIDFGYDNMAINLNFETAKLLLEDLRKFILEAN
ncbi:hypothetical protein FBHYGVHD_CDS0014 [Staphylococcus phage MVC_VPHSA1]|uniref:Uncharacterized protein n=1 Tax=Staphylococcus phage MVC_VPHSA1 TaxID=3088876 RepID=A0ABZ0QZL4_9CAUD|nr:hypothetical protein FBHYGVHD_CDS0014 [Staphylococcus phage MVC_VPHSA1]